MVKGCDELYRVEKCLQLKNKSQQNESFLTFFCVENMFIIKITTVVFGKALEIVYVVRSDVASSNI